MTDYQSFEGRSAPKSTASLVCGILSIVFAPSDSFLVCAAGITLGIVAIALGVRHSKRYGKSGMATAGKVCGIVGLSIFGALFLFSFAAAFMGAFLFAFYDSSPTTSLLYV